MSTQKKIVNYHIARLRDRDRMVRLDAIRELQEIGDPDSFEPLHFVFETDDDLDVRRAAQIAGRKVFVKGRSNAQNAAR